MVLKLGEGRGRFWCHAIVLPHVACLAPILAVVEVVFQKPNSLDSADAVASPHPTLSVVDSAIQGVAWNLSLVSQLEELLPSCPAVLVVVLESLNRPLPAELVGVQFIPIVPRGSGLSGRLSQRVSSLRCLCLPWHVRYVCSA